MSEKKNYTIVDKCSNCGASIEFEKKETKQRIEDGYLCQYLNFYIECPNCGHDHLWRFERVKEPDKK